MDARKIGYAATTGLVTLGFAFGGIMDLSKSPEIMQGMTALGYPAYVATLLGVWKLLGAAAVAAPGLPRLKEWAYAGMFFDLSGAFVSHAASGDGTDKLMPPLVLLALVLASWALRPASRVLGAPIVADAGQPRAAVSHAA